MAAEIDSRVDKVRDGRAGIWKTKANALFALSLCKELAHLPYRKVELAPLHGRRTRYMHVLCCKQVLELAFARHGVSFEAINAAYVKRRLRIAHMRELHKRACLAIEARHPKRMMMMSTPSSSDDDDY